MVDYSALPKKHYNDQGINPALMGLWADLCNHFLEESSTATNMLCSSWAFLCAEVVFNRLDDPINESLAQECKHHFNDGYAEKLNV